jgi:hypothetical protein
MNNDISSSESEIVNVLPDLDITQFNHWEDYLYNLQVGHIKLTNIDKQKSNEIGHYGFCISQHLIQNLRENQTDETGQPFVICTDEVTNEQVITEASTESKQNAFLQAFISQAIRRGFHDLPQRAESYATASITLGLAVLNQDISETVTLLSETLTNNDQLYNPDKEVLLDSLANPKTNDIKSLTQYLQFSQTQMTNEEQRILVTAQKETPRLGDKPIDINGQQYEFVGSHNRPIEINPNDAAMLVPLQKAIKKSRQDMIEQAREFSFQYLGIDRNKHKNQTPPSWWVNSENGEGLQSNEILIYIPHEAKQLENLDTPKFAKNLMNDQQFRFGWNKLVLSKEHPNFIIGIHKLNN